MFEKTFVYKTPLLCNAKCWFCLSKATQTNKVYNYPKHKIVWELLTIKKKWFKSIILVWWESTIINNLDDYIKVGKKLWLEIIVTTNGITLSKFDYIKYLHWLWLDNIIFSFHSHKSEIHDELVWVKWAFECIEKSMRHAKKLWFKHISTSSVICHHNQEDLVELITYIRSQHHININNFCNLEISANNQSDYKNKSYLFPDLATIKDQIKWIHKIFYWTQGEIGLQNLPLCAYEHDTMYLTHESSWKERYYENDFEWDKVMNHRIKSDTCNTCRLYSKCKWYFPYFNMQDIQPFH